MKVLNQQKKAGDRKSTNVRTYIQTYTEWQRFVNTRQDKRKNKTILWI